MKPTISLFIFFMTAFLASAQSTITPEQAKDHEGTFCTVCGFVKSTHYNADGKGQPTYLNFGAAYPNQVFTALIWGSDRKNLSYAPETYLKGKSVCVTGMVIMYKGKPEIIVKKQGQIEIK